MTSQIESTRLTQYTLLYGKEQRIKSMETTHIELAIQCDSFCFRCALWDPVIQILTVFELSVNQGSCDKHQFNQI